MLCLTSVNTGNGPATGSKRSGAAPTITSTNVNVRTLIYLLKYWCLYAIIFGVFSANLTWTILGVIPFASLAFLVLNGLVTLELVYQFIEFIESQDGKVLFLFNKFNDSNVTWWQWFSYATTYDDNNIASNFIFGKVTQFLISLANRSPFSRTDYLERGFNMMELYLRQFTHTIIMQRKSYQQQQQRQRRSQRREDPAGAHSARSSTSSVAASISKLGEGYDFLDDIIEESRQRKP